MNSDNINNLFASAETGSLRLDLSLTNDLRSFVFNLRSSVEYSNAKESVKSDLAYYVKFISERMFVLLGNDFDEKYLHPYDIAIASYLFLISEVSIKEAVLLSNNLLEKGLRNAWWTSQMIDYLRIYQDVSSTITQIESIDFVPLLSEKVNQETTSKTTETLSI